MQRMKSVIYTLSGFPSSSEEYKHLVYQTMNCSCKTNIFRIDKIHRIADVDSSVQKNSASAEHTNTNSQKNKSHMCVGGEMAWLDWVLHFLNDSEPGEPGNTLLFHS
jgi:hypothetical protein